MIKPRRTSALTTVIVLGGLWVPTIARADVIYNYTFLPETSETFAGLGTLNISGSFIWDVTAHKMVSTAVTVTGAALGPGPVAPLFADYDNTWADSSYVTVADPSSSYGFIYTVAGNFVASPGTFGALVVGNMSRAVTVDGTFWATGETGGVSVSAPAPASLPGAGLPSLIALGGAALWSRRDWLRQALRR